MTHMPTYHEVDPPRGFSDMCAMLKATRQANPFSMDGVEPDRIFIGARMLDTLDQEFRQIARVYYPTPDPPGKDIWKPLEPMRSPNKPEQWLLAGDCEKSVLTLILYLLAAGLPRGCMTIVTCLIHDREEPPLPIGHAVLAIETMVDTLICDFRLREGEGDIQPWDAPVFRGKLPGHKERYKWVSRQQPGSDRWVSLKALPTVKDVADQIPEDTTPDLDPNEAALAKRIFDLEARVSALEDGFVRIENLVAT